MHFPLPFYLSTFSLIQPDSERYKIQREMDSRGRPAAPICQNLALTRTRNADQICSVNLSGTEEFE